MMKLRHVMQLGSLLLWYGNLADGNHYCTVACDEPSYLILLEKMGLASWKNEDEDVRESNHFLNSETYNLFVDQHFTCQN